MSSKAGIEGCTVGEKLGESFSSKLGKAEPVLVGTTVGS